MAEIPRPRFGLAFVGLALATLFVFLGFPYDRLADLISDRVRQQTGVELGMASLGPSFGFAGPGLLATDVDVRLQDGNRVALDRARVRLAWSLSWFRGTPAIHAGLASPLGEAVGVFTLNGAGAWRGELRQVSLEKLPLSALWPGLAAQGELEGAVDLRLMDVGPVGRVDFEAHEGSLTLPGLRVAIPFEYVESAIAFEEDTRVTIEAFVLEGPLLSADVRGQLAPTEPLGDSRIALEIELQSEPGIRSLLESAGLVVNDDGSAVLRVGGTVANPRTR